MQVQYQTFYDTAYVKLLKHEEILDFSGSQLISLIILFYQIFTVCNYTRDQKSI